MVKVAIFDYGAGNIFSLKSSLEKNEAEVDQSGVKLENSVTDQIFTSDWHNALKLGYDVHTLSYSTWMINLLLEQGILSSFIPTVIEPGRTVSTVSSRLVEMGFSEKCNVVAGNCILFFLNLILVFFLLLSLIM